MTLTFQIPGQPQGKGRARSFLRGDRIAHITPGKTRTYEGIVAALGMQAMTGRQPFTGPARLVLRAVFEVPASWPIWKRQQALDGMIMPCGKPDLDNVAKAITDGLNGIAWNDDAQIACLVVSKCYGPHAHVGVEIDAIAASAPQHARRVRLLPMSANAELSRVAAKEQNDG